MGKEEVVEIKDYQSGSYDPKKAAGARFLAEESDSAIDAGHFDRALELCTQAFELEPPLRLEASILFNVADALTERFKPVALGQKSPSPEDQGRLEWLKKTLDRLMELINVPDPFDIVLHEQWHKKGEKLIFDLNTYFRNDEKEEVLGLVNYYNDLFERIRTKFPRK